MARLLLEAREEDRQREAEESRGAAALLPAIPFAIALLAFALRLYQLGANSLWYDEAFSVYVSGLDLVELTRHTAGDIHPPLYYYVLHFWMGLTGNSEFVLAFLSLLFGVLLVAATYRIAARIFDRSVATAAALLVAASPFHLWYSQEVRMYTLAALLALAALWFALEAVAAEGSGKGTMKPWAAYAVFSALGLYVLYYVAFALISLNVLIAGWVLLGSQRRHLSAFARKWLLAQLTIIALYLPWLPAAIRQIFSPAVPPWRHFTELGQALQEAWSVLSLGQSSDPSESWPFLLIAGGLYALGLLAASRLYGRFPALLLAGTTWVPVLVIFLISLVTPLFHARYVFIYSPLFYVTLALGIVFAMRFSLALGLLSLLVMIGAFAGSAQAYFHADTYAPDDYRSAVRYLEGRAGPHDAFMVNSGYVYPALLYYYKGELGWRGRLTDYAKVEIPSSDGPVVVQTGMIGGDAGLGWGDPKADFYATTQEEVKRALEMLAERHDRVWLLRAYDTIVDPQGFVRDWLAQNAALLDDIQVQGSSNIRLQSYLLARGKSATPGGQIAANFDNAIAIASFETSTPVVESGSNVALRFSWLRQGEFAKDVRAYVALVDEKGRVWQQQDNVPVGRLYPSSKWTGGVALADTWRFPIPPGTPPGTYNLVSGVYVAAGGQRLEVRGSDGKSLGPQATLGRLDIKASPSASLPANLANTKEELGAGLGLAGYKLGSHRLKPGESLHVDLFWRALAAPQSDFTPSLVLKDSGGNALGRQEGQPADGRHPTSKWQKGELVWDQRDFAIDAAVPDGDYKLFLAVNGKETALDTVKVRGRPRNYDVPQGIANRVSLRLGDSVELLGFDVEPAAGAGDKLASTKPGQKIRLVLYWRSLKRTEASYTVFTQLLDANLRIQGQRDRPPGDGALPTTSWLPNEIITDAYEVQIKPDAAPGDLLLVVGMYDPKTGQRLSMTDAGGQSIGDAYVLGKVEAKPSSP